MDKLQRHPLLQVTEDDVRKAREFYNLDENRISESLEAIGSWFKKQDHLAEVYRLIYPDLLERLFLMSRGSVEMTKNKLDKLFTMRGMMPDICLNMTYREFEELNDWLIYVPLPKLNPADQTRVMMTQVISGKADDWNMLAYMRYSFLVGEFRLHYDYSLGDRYVIDLQNTTFSLVTKLNPIILKKAEILCTEGFGTKIKGIHFLNAPSFVDKLVAIVKQGLRGKVANRLHVHRTYEDFHNEISKEILPKEYGGDGPSCAKLAELWRDTLKTKEAEKIIEINNKLISDETKRMNGKFNEEYFGIPGSFRSLTVD
uniref:CRAL-TRIO domain-containing protein n=1 Tax=Bicyclus anynana TaxID=110368 RepID=A0A2H4RMV1_BICAN|nr:CRAL-TRIO domain-containing protein [Bicyclus anynana]